MPVGDGSGTGVATYHRPVRRLLHPLAALLVTAALAGGCGDTGDTSPTSPDSIGAPAATDATTATVEAPEPVPAPVSWRACGGGLDCATVTVPLDYADPGGPTVDLAVARRPAADPSARIGSLFVHPGGPGASGIEYLRAGLGQPFGDRFDLVAWDPRGVGDSGTLGCAGDIDALRSLDPAPGNADGLAALTDAARRAADSCTASAGALLAHLDASVNARDLDQLRRAVGDDALNFLGYSYGTLVGLEYARRYPARVRTLALDGVVDPAAALETLLTGQTDAIERQINERFAPCEGAPVDASCPLDDPAAAYDRVAARVRVASLPAGAGATLGPEQLAFAAISATYGGADATAQLLRGLADADRRGDGTRLATLAAAYGSGADTDAYVAVTCVDSPHPTGTDGWRALADRLAARSRRFGAAAANEVLPCAYWPVPPTRVPEPVTPTALGPALVIGTTGDAATPYADAVAVAAALPGAVLLTYDGIGHTASGRNRCIAAATNAYLVDLTLPEPGTVCS